MSISAGGQGSREKIKTPKPKGISAIPVSNSQNLVAAAPQTDGSLVPAEPAKSSHATKNPPRLVILFKKVINLLEHNNNLFTAWNTIFVRSLRKKGSIESYDT